MLLLEWMLGGAPQYAHVIERAGVPGYCFGRQGRLFDQIGPVVAPDDETARALVGASLAAAAGRAVVVDAFDRERASRRGCTAADSPASGRCSACAARAEDGRPWAEQSGRPVREFAILGPELG